MRLKQNTPNKVLYEIIGDPECEWKRRNMELENDRESLKRNLEYQDLQKKRRERQCLRKRLFWSVIHIASIPVGLKRMCKKCKEIHRFEHIKIHVAENLKGVVDEILSIIPNERALEKLVNLNKYGELTDQWKRYTTTFKNRK